MYTGREPQWKLPSGLQMLAIRAANVCLLKLRSEGDTLHFISRFQ